MPFRPGALICTLTVVTALAGCGGSSSKTSSNTGSGGANTSGGANASGGANGTSGPQGDFAARRAQLAACLKQQGVTLPPRPNRPSNGPTGPGGFLGGGGGGGGRFGQFFSNPKLRAAAQKCGLRLGQGGGLRNPAFRAQIQRFVACVRQNGYPQIPNPSPTGPPFRPNQLNRGDPKFQAAAHKCQGLLPRGGGGPGG
jgi:hypothetical protein